MTSDLLNNENLKVAIAQLCNGLQLYYYIKVDPKDQHNLKNFEGLKNRLGKVFNNKYVNAVPLCRCSTGADRSVNKHFWRVGSNVHMVG